MSAHPGPSAVTLRPMDWDAYDAWSEHSLQGFVAQQVAAGSEPEQEAREHARRAMTELLPSGLATPLHRFWTVHEPVDGQPLVGYLWMRVRVLSSEVEAYVFDVELVEAARGRGLGRATMLAAEEAALGEGATVVRLNVFGHNTAARNLYESLGYTVTSAQMTRTLTGDEPEPDPPVELRAMTAAQFDAFRPRLQADYARNLAGSGSMPPREAEDKARDDLDHLLPDGVASVGHLLRAAYDGQGEPVGVVWVQLRERSDGRHAFGYELEVPQELRGRGYGRAIVAATLRLCHAEGARTVGLSVFGFNDVARGIYEAQGFRVTAASMAKPLPSAPARTSG